MALTVFLAAGDQGDSPKVAWTVAGLYLLGGPTVHALHRRPGILAGSLAMRLMLPLLGLGIGGSMPCHRSQNSDEGCSMGGAFIGLGVGLGVAVILDSAWLAWDPAPAPASSPRSAPTPAAKVSLSPAPLRGGAGLVLAGLF
ncbi:MAG TPA: hypothetical protein VHU40_16560 [Polyangia bacterium]|nr:hypothetical protein [Polyangia bacterium]